MRFWLFIFFIFSLSQPLFSHDSVSRDTINNIVTSADPYEQLQDSLYRQRMQRSINENGKVLEEFLADFKERQEREKRQTYIRIGLGIAFVALLIYGLLRRRKARQQQP